MVSQEEHSKRKRSASPGGASAKRHEGDCPVIKASENAINLQNGCGDISPLEKQLLPKTLQEFYGQEHVLGPETALYSILSQGDVPNMILWGPPGCGKTSLAEIIRNICETEPIRYKYFAFSATSVTLKDIEKVMSDAKADLEAGLKTVIFIDQIHRFSRSQQEVFLKPIEQAEITLVGATTENPSSSCHAALLSRCRVVVLERLQGDAILNILYNAADALDIKIFNAEDSGTDEKHAWMEEDALKWLSEICDGDARIGINNLDFLLKSYTHEGKIITLFDIKEIIKKSHVLYDKRGDNHHNLLSAMHKSIQSSDPNGTLYWLTRMIMGGDKPEFIARRLVRAASEDIGEADPQALILASSTLSAAKYLGMPDSDVLLAQCATYLAKAKKSRKIDIALSKAKKAISESRDSLPEVPLHLRNMPAKFLAELGQAIPAKGASNLPDSLKGANFFGVK